MFRQALETGQRAFGEVYPDTRCILDYPAALLQAQGRRGTAEPLLRHALAVIQGTFGVERRDTLCILGEEHPSSMICLNNVARLLPAQSRLGEAEPLFRQALETGQRAFGEVCPDCRPEPPQGGEAVELAGLWGQAAHPRRTFGEERPNLLTCPNNLARLLRALGRLEETTAVGAGLGGQPAHL